VTGRWRPGTQATFGGWARLRDLDERAVLRRPGSVPVAFNGHLDGDRDSSSPAHFAYLSLRHLPRLPAASSLSLSVSSSPIILWPPSHHPWPAALLSHAPVYLLPTLTSRTNAPAPRIKHTHLLLLLPLAPPIPYLQLGTTTTARQLSSDMLYRELCGTLPPWWHAAGGMDGGPFQQNDRLRGRLGCELRDTTCAFAGDRRWLPSAPGDSWGRPFEEERCRKWNRQFRPCW